MHANLVRAPGVGPSLDEMPVARTGDDAECRLRRLAFRIDDDASDGLWIGRETQSARPCFFFWSNVRDGKINFFHAPRLEHVLKRVQGTLAFRKEQDARGLRIQTVDVFQILEI